MDKWNLFVGIVLSFLAIGILAVSVLALPVWVIQYSAFSNESLEKMNDFYGSTSTYLVGTATVFDMVFNRNCVKIHNPKTFNYNTQNYNKPFALNIVNCDASIKIRWLYD